MSLFTGKTTDSVEKKNSAMWSNRGYLCCQLGVAIALGISGAIASSFDRVIAQLVPDPTLGAESSVVTPQARGSGVELIQGGATRGANLFHSFEQFSVLTGREAFFNNATDMQNITSRVTGTSIFNIEPEAENRSSAAPSLNPTRISTPTQIVEANGWAIAPNGEIILTASASTLTPHSPAFCSGS